MRVAHICIVTPGRCGLYETTRELVSGLRGMGVDSRLIDIPGSNKVYKGGYPESEDRGAPVADMDWAVSADIVVSHSGYDGTAVDKTSQPIIHVAHGRPRSSFLSEKEGKTKIYTYHYNKNYDRRWAGVVTFWPEHKKHLKVMFPDKPIHVVQSPVDLEYWSPGDDSYDFHGNRGKINVVCTDAWRSDVDPFMPLNAFTLWARKQKGAKFHLYAVPSNLNGFKPMIHRIKNDGNLGELVQWTTRLREVYRAADVMITGNDINTRSVREAMACGCPVVRVSSFEDIEINPDRESIRKEAETRFNPAKTAIQFKRILDAHT